MSQWKRFKRSITPALAAAPTQTLTHLRSGRLAMLLGMLLVGGVAFGMGRWIGLGAGRADTPQQRVNANGVPTLEGEYESRVVAYIYGNIPISRVELAEYLISRFGAERLEFLVNRKIVERACQAKGIVVSDAEIENQFRRDIQAIGPHMTAQSFHDQVLKRYNKTIFEWKEDVIRPKLALTKLVQSEVQVTDNDIRKQFEIHYGPKVKCRMIVYNDGNTARRAWERMSNSSNVGEAFMIEAGTQMIGELASVKGEVPPIHKHFGDERIEKEAFRLRPGEISQAFEMSDRKAIILLCERHLPADNTKTFEKERVVLLPEVRDLMVAQKVQERVVQLRTEATPRFLLARNPSNQQIQRDAQQEINSEVRFEKK